MLNYITKDELIKIVEITTSHITKLVEKVNDLQDQLNTTQEKLDSYVDLYVHERYTNT